MALGLNMKIKMFATKIAAIITTNLQAWHKFTPLTWNGSTNRLTDSSPVATNTAIPYTGRGLSFDGVNDVVTVGATGNTIKTVIFCANPDTTTQSFMQLQSTGAVRIQIASGTLSATGFTSPTLYVNGVASSTVAASSWQMIAVTSATGVSASNVLLGQQNTTFYAGKLSNVRFFDIELNSTQIAELYANPEMVYPTGAAVSNVSNWWELNGANVLGGTNSGSTALTGLPSPVSQLAFKKQASRMFFDGVNDYITIPTFTPSTSFSIYFKGLFNSSDSYIMGGPSGTYVRFLDTTISFNLAGTNPLFETITLGSSYKNRMFSCTINVVSGALKCWVNGSLVFTGTDTFSGLTGSYTSLMLYVVFYGTGALSECAIYNTVLSDAEASNVSGGSITLTDSSILSKCWAAWRNNGITSADWADLTSNARNGTVSGSPANIILTDIGTGVDRLGLTCSRSNNGQFILNSTGYAEIADASSLDITTAITLEAWVKPFAVTAAQSIIGKNNAYALNITSGAKLQFSKWTSAANGTFASTASIVTTAWTHVCATYTSGTVTLYINGAQDSTSASLTGAIDATSTNVLMGALTTSSNLFDGYIDNVRIYSSALTAAQVLNNYTVERSNYQ